MSSGARVDLYWLPLGAGTGNRSVRASGRLYEALAAWRGKRPRQPLFHSALRVVVDDAVFVIEMAPVWDSTDPGRGVVSEGAVGRAWLGRCRWFRYEVRRWPNGTIADMAFAVDSPRRLSTDRAGAARLLSCVLAFPTATWGLDELGTGEMWNSNSLVFWLLAVSGHDTDMVTPPRGGRAPGWQAGLVHASTPKPLSARVVAGSSG